jgi:hypothetical protein
VLLDLTGVYHLVKIICFVKRIPTVLQLWPNSVRQMISPRFPSFFASIAIKDNERSDTLTGQLSRHSRFLAKLFCTSTKKTIIYLVEKFLPTYPQKNVNFEA